MFFLLPILCFFFASPAAVSAQAVFAHVLVGLTWGWSPSQWAADMALAQDAGIDGFVLNYATPGSNYASSVASAFDAADSLGFKLFFSFDYNGGAGPWAPSDVITVLQTYIGRPSYWKYKGKPFVSTFEGPGNAGDWPSIRAAIPGGIHFVPDWTSMGSYAFSTQQLGNVDGAFSWDIWPQGANDMTSWPDHDWQNALAGKTYMMGVSPWFFADLAVWGKQWMWRGDDLWHQRWEQVFEVKPDIVQLVSWNDFGESHYIGPLHPDSYPATSGSYVSGMPHDGWRATLPYYIEKYKNNGVATVKKEVLQYWYRLSPKAAGTSDGVQGNAPWQPRMDPDDIVQDKVFVTAIVGTLPASVTVKIGGSVAGTYQCTTIGANSFSVDFGGHLGTVTVDLIKGGKSVLQGVGTALLASPPSGTKNYNAWVGSVSGSVTPSNTTSSVISSSTSFSSSSSTASSTITSSASTSASSSTVESSSSSTLDSSSSSSTLSSSTLSSSTSSSTSSDISSSSLISSTFSSSSTLTSSSAVASSTTTSSRSSSLTSSTSVPSTFVTKTSTSSSSTRASSTLSSSATPTVTGTVKCPGSNKSYFVDPTSRKRFLIECSTDYAGGDLSSVNGVTFNQCIARCASTAACVDVSYQGNACYMKKTLKTAKTVSTVWTARLVG